MAKEVVTPSNIDTYHATELVQVPSIKCPECGTATPLSKLVAEQECENCKTTLKIHIETETN